MGQVFGYARVSTVEQNLQMQFDALLEAGCDRILTEKASASGERPELTHLFDLLRAGDTVVVWRLDRLGRSVHDLIDLVEDLQTRGVALKSLRETIDTISAGGRLVVHVFAALAEFERDLIRERTVAGLASARAHGRMAGRPRALSPDQARLARSAFNAGETSVNDIAAALGVARVDHLPGTQTRRKRLGSTLWAGGTHTTLAATRQLDVERLHRSSAMPSRVSRSPSGP